ncbi:MAG: MBL fold metallo-hydrolase [Pyrinomonadaceae bacterium]
MSENKICTACGTQFPLAKMPQVCPICEDDRQYVPETGQTWTTHSGLAADYTVRTRQINENLFELLMTPTFAIGQRALLVQAPDGNILWDCIPLLDEPTIEFIKSKGGLKAIAFSHPHFYSNMNFWAEVFDCPIYIHEKDEQWIFNRGDHIKLWSETEKELWNGIKIINIGGHFAGSSILHIPFLSPEGTILCGDTFVISPNKNHLAAMHSYPNKIPLPIKEVLRIKRQMLDLEFDTIHAWIDSQSIERHAKRILENSLAKYT